MKSFPAIRIEGGLFSPDILDALYAGDLEGQQPADFHLPENANFIDEVAAVFADAQTLWQVFRRRWTDELPDTSTTRDRWVIPFLSLLGYELQYNEKRYRDEGGHRLALSSHRAGKTDTAPPVEITEAGQDLNRVLRLRRPPMAPHTLVQDLLNRTEALWGLVTNGRQLRLLRDSTYLRRQSYVEFDLEAIFEQHLFPDFIVLFRLLHRTRLPLDDQDPTQCLLEKYYRQSIEQGERVRERLREGVEACILRLGNGFLSHPANEALRKQLFGESHEANNGEAEQFFHELLRLVYRLLFLIVAESRGLLSNDPRYVRYYGLLRFQDLVTQRAAYTQDVDLWHALRVLRKLLADSTRHQSLGGKPLAALLGLPVLNGELFEHLPLLDDSRISNADLLHALWLLLYYKREDGSYRRVNYAALDVEELGSVYESLLEIHPVLHQGTPPSFSFRQGSERKSTGSYYTPAELVGELVDSALEPVVQQRLANARTPAEKERTLLSLNVVDPACGSGHFLLAAARHLGKHLAAIRAGQDEPPPDEVRAAIRDVVAHCIYGVDKNPLAVELCRVALWIESHDLGKPLTFLDHHIRCGDSLVGVIDLDCLKEGVPREAYKAVRTEDKKVAASARKANDEVLKKKQGSLFAGELPDFKALKNLATPFEQLEHISDDSPEQIRKKRALYQQLQQDPLMQRWRTACDLWTAAFFQHLTAEADPDLLITTLHVWQALTDKALHPRLAATAQAYAHQHRFFHWPLEFPDVFVRGGFDVVLGNPPWEQIQLEEQEFFATRDPAIAAAPNAAARKRLIKALPQTNPALWAEYRRALQAAERASRFLRGSGLFPLTGRGRINTYSVFAERVRHLLAPHGRAGIIVPTGTATDATNQYFFADLVEKGQIHRLIGFENEALIFSDVHHAFKFCALTIGGDQNPCEEPDFAFFCRYFRDVENPTRHFLLTRADITRINPNTRTLPVFRTRQDADLTRAIYQRVPVLVNERTDENPWGITFKQGLFNMSSDSHLFRTRAELQAQGYRLAGNVFVRGEDVYLPLYEAKMIWQYDHRFGSYEERGDKRGFVSLPETTEAQHQAADYVVQPFYWVPQTNVEERLSNWQRHWLIGFRDVTSAVVQRTVIFSLLPCVGANHKVPLVLLEATAALAGCCYANVNSLVFDFVTRQKIGGTSLGFFILRQLPAFSPTAYTPEDLRFIVPRVLELAYTAWDLAAFAADVWHDADDPATGSGQALRAALRAQWQANAEATGGVDPTPPGWLPLLGVDAAAAPFPPFKWDSERRAILQAELDAYYARLYGLTRKQLRYILDPADLTARELEDILDPWEEVADPLDPQGYAERAAASDFPGETFRVLKEKEIRAYGEYRTRRLVLEAWEALH